MPSINLSSGLSRRGNGESGCLGLIVLCLLIWLGVWGYQKVHEPPIQTSFRGSWLYTHGKVLQVRNIGTTRLGCCVEMVNVKGDQRVKYRFTVAPGDHEEIGTLECNWNFETNESVTLYTDGYTTLHFTVP